MLLWAAMSHLDEIRTERSKNPIVMMTTKGLVTLLSGQVNKDQCERCIYRLVFGWYTKGLGRKRRLPPSSVRSSPE